MFLFYAIGNPPRVPKLPPIPTVPGYKGKYHDNPVIDHFAKVGEEMARSEVHKRSSEALEKFGKIMEKIPISGSVNIGTVENGMSSLVNASSRHSPYRYQFGSIVQPNNAESRIYRGNFHIGTPSTGGLYKFCKTKTIDIKSLVDTDRDYLSSEDRQSLDIHFGFNQRVYNFFLTDTFLTAGDYQFLFQGYEKNFKTKLANKNIYGNVFYEHLKWKFKSETDFYSIRLKLHLVKIHSPNVNVDSLFLNTFFHDLKKEDPRSAYKIPIDRQLSEIKTYKKFRKHVLTDLKCTLGMSDYFKDNATIVKTFSKNLGPQDEWDFSYYLHLGPGVLLNRLYEENRYDSSHPAGYFFIIQAQGDPRASVTRRSDEQNFNVSSPGRFNCSFVKKLKFAKELNDPSEKITIREFVNNDEDFENSKFRDYFSPNRKTTINANYEAINVSRVENTKKEYELRYGEGRLAVYVEPKKLSLLDVFLKNTNSTSTNTTNTTQKEENNRQQPVQNFNGELDPDQEFKGINYLRGADYPEDNENEDLDIGD